MGKKEGIAEGIKKGIEKGIEEGIEKGKLEERESLIAKLLAKGYTDEQIQDLLK